MRDGHHAGFIHDERVEALLGEERVDAGLHGCRKDDRGLSQGLASDLP